MARKTKYKGIYKLKSGAIQVIISLGTDPVTGKRVRIKTTVDDYGKPFENFTEANKYITLTKAKYYKTGNYSVSKMTFKSFIEEEFIPWYRTTVREQTFESKLPIFRHIKLYFKNLKLKDINVRKVNDFQIWLKSTGFSDAYTSIIYSTFKRVLEHALRLDYITSNPAHKLDPLPKGKANVKFWTKEEFEKVLSVICLDDFYEHLMYVTLIVYFTTGARVNEGTALMWDDVNFSKKTLHINKNIVPKGKRNELKPTNGLKTENANRIISLDDETIEVLKKWKKRQRKYGLNNYILTYDGLPLIKSTIGRNVKKFAKIAGVHPIQPKSLRHSHASYLIHEFNMDIVKLCRRLGHSSAEITLRHYAHLYPNRDRDIIDKMGSQLNFKSAKNSSLKFNGNQSVNKQTVPQ
ncbi:MAG TPA: tyrosine-type recombinase/integrase [Pseudogracilibacillus sp.]|nr:tyrosine-type recombinase/integrase [Pseudogracilibacillus sp.]